jgi:hypothetical protein
VAWPEQRKGILPRGSVATVFEFLNDLSAFEPVTEGQKALHMQTIRTFNEFEERRTSRLLGVTARLSSPLWALIYIGAVINIAVTWCFHLNNQKMHLWMTALTSVLLGLMIFFLGAMDHPYLGEISVSPKPFQLVYDHLMKSGQFAPGSDAPSTPQTR